MGPHQRDGAQSQRRRAGPVHRLAVVDKELLQRRSGEEPHQICQGTGEGHKQAHSQQRPEGTGIGQDIGRQGHEAEDHHLDVGEIDQQARQEAGSAGDLPLRAGGGAQGVPRHPQKIGRAHPGQGPHILVQQRAHQPCGQHRRHGHQEKPGEQAPPLPEGRALAVAQGGGQGTEVGGAGGDGAYIAVEQERGQQGSRHRDHILF